MKYISYHISILLCILLIIGCDYHEQSSTDTNEDLLEAPTIVKIQSYDPDNMDTVFSTGDVILITYNEATNKPPGSTKEEIDSLYRISKSIGSDYSGLWLDSSNHEITILNPTDATIQYHLDYNYSTHFQLKASAQLKNITETSTSSTSSYYIYDNSFDWGYSIPAHLKVQASDQANILTWDNENYPAYHYKIYWSKSPEFSSRVQVITTNTPNHTHSGLENGIQYYYYVTAYNFKSESSPSKIVSAKPFKTPNFKPLTWTNYTVANTSKVLPDYKITASHLDQLGNIWFATAEGGVSKYDGEEWKTYQKEDGLTNNQVTSISEDSNGTLWFGTTKGLCKFDGSNWQSYTENSGLLNNKVNIVFVDDSDVIWIGTDGGANSFDNDSWKRYQEVEGPGSTVILDIIQYENGAILFATHKGLYKLDKDIWTMIEPIEGNDYYASKIFLDSKGEVWTISYDSISNISIPNTGIWIPGNLNWHNYRAITSIAEDTRGNIWIGTDGQGLMKFDGLKWTNQLTKENGLLSDSVSSITIGNDGELWVGTDEGVSKYDGKTWTSFYPKGGLIDNNVKEIYVDNNGSSWFGTTRGLSKFDGSHWTNFTTREGLAGNDINSILEDNDGVMWFGTTNGLSKYNNDLWTTYNTDNGLKTSHITSGFKDIKGNLWYITKTPNGSAINKFDGLSWKISDDFETIKNIIDDSLGRIIFLQSDFSFYLEEELELKNATEKKQYVAPHTELIFIDHIGRDWFNDFGGTSYGGHIDANLAFEDSMNSIWFGKDSSNLISRYQDNHWTYFDTTKGYKSKSVQSIYEDTSKGMWFGSIENGVTLLKSKIITSKNYLIEWDDTDSQIECKVSFYYDNDSYGFDGSPIVRGIEETDNYNSYNWDTSNIPEGTYYIYYLFENDVSTKYTYFDIPIIIQK